MNEPPPPPDGGLLRTLFRLPRPFLGLALLPFVVALALFSGVVYVVGYLFFDWLRR